MHLTSLPTGCPFFAPLLPLALQQRSKGLLPDTGSPYEGEGGNVHDAIDSLAHFPFPTSPLSCPLSFLLSLLQQRSKGLLPDTGSPYEGEGGNVHDAIDFLLSNFIEMNKLWVRMQHQVRRSMNGCGNVWGSVG